MAVEDTLVALLKSVAPVAALANNRVFQTYPAQDTVFPLVRYHLLTRPAFQDLNGKIPNPRKATYEIDVMGDGPAADLRTIAAAIADLRGKQTISQAGATLLWLFIDDDTDDLTPPQQADERGLRHEKLQVTLWYTVP